VKILVACFVLFVLFETSINQRLLRLCVFVESNECFGVQPKRKMYFDVYVRRSMMFKGRLLIVVAFVAVMLISANAQAYVLLPGGGMNLTTADGTGADMSVRNHNPSTKGGPNQPNGTAVSFEVRNYANTRIFIGYMRFDLTNIVPDVGHTVADYLNGATLSLETFGDAKGGPLCTRWAGIYGLKDGTVATSSVGGEDWPEATTTFGGGNYWVGGVYTAMLAAPGIVTAAPPGFYAFTDPTLNRLGEIYMVKQPKEIQPAGAAIIVTSNHDPVVQTITGAGITIPYLQAGNLDLDAFLTADTNKLVTLVITYEMSSASSGIDWYITSKEGVGVSIWGATQLGTLAPTLNLPNAIPEPATIALLGLGGLSLLRIRRKR
jgi:hypothetical protein